MGAGDSAREEAARQLALAAAHEVAAVEARDAAARYDLAATTERRTADLLSALAALGHHLLPDRGWPGSRNAQVDLVVVGPSGVFIVDTKSWKDVSIVDGRIYRGQADVTEELEKLEGLGIDTEEALAAGGPRTWRGAHGRRPRWPSGDRGTRWRRLGSRRQGRRAPHSASRAPVDRAAGGRRADSGTGLLPPGGRRSARQRRRRRARVAARRTDGRRHPERGGDGGGPGPGDHGRAGRGVDDLPRARPSEVGAPKASTGQPVSAARSGRERPSSACTARRIWRGRARGACSSPRTCGRSRGDGEPPHPARPGGGRPGPFHRDLRLRHAPAEEQGRDLRPLGDQGAGDLRCRVGARR